MVSAIITGQLAENLSGQFLQQQGASILERNYRCNVGELDIIAKHNDSIVFVEVRFRKNIAFGNPLETITLSKQKKLIKAASYYLQRNKNFAKKPCRFDVIAVTIQQNEYQFEWIQHAFDGH